MRLGLPLLGLGGLVLLGILVLENDAVGILSAAAAIGWGLVAVLLFRAVPVLFDALGWHVLFAAPCRPPVTTAWWVRWISESVNALLPVAQVGGEVVRAHLISRRAIVPRPEVTPADAAATVLVDMSTGLIATALFSLMGLLLLARLHADAGVAGGLWWALGALLLMAGGFALAQRSGALGRGVRAVARRLAREKAEAFIAEARALDRAFERIWHDHGALLLSTFWRTASFLAGAAEVWLVLHLLGADVGWADAVMLEALSTAARSAAFAVPGGLGVQEASLLLLGQSIGIDAQTALALALVKRMREILTGLPALALWWWVALRRRT